MATIVIRVDITVTSAYTKTTLPGGPVSTGDRTLSSTASAVDKIAEINRKFWSDQFDGAGVPDSAVTISTQTVT